MSDSSTKASTWESKGIASRKFHKEHFREIGRLREVLVRDEERKRRVPAHFKDRTRKMVCNRFFSEHETRGGVGSKNGKVSAPLDKRQSTWSPKNNEQGERKGYSQKSLRELKVQIL